MTPAEQQAEIAKIPPAQAVTLVLEFVDGSSEDWCFETPREAKDFILAIQAAKMGYGESWLQDIFKIGVRPFLPSVN